MINFASNMSQGHAAIRNGLEHECEGAIRSPERDEPPKLIAE